jgi:hypothetical protein
MDLQIEQMNVPAIMSDLDNTMDFFVTQGCYDDVLTYAAVGKPIYAAEYTGSCLDFAAACAYGDANDVSFILKDRDLTAALQTCP